MNTTLGKAHWDNEEKRANHHLQKGKKRRGNKKATKGQHGIQGFLVLLLGEVALLHLLVAIMPQMISIGGNDCHGMFRLSNRFQVARIIRWQG